MRSVQLKKLPKQTKSKKSLLLSIIVFAILGIGFYIIFLSGSSVDAPSSSSTDPSNAFDKNKHPTDEAPSLWAVVNKGRKLPDSYMPKNLVTPSVVLRQPAGTTEMKLRKETSTALEALFSAAKQHDINLMLVSGYRSYIYQAGVYSGYVRSLGQEQADSTSARASHSEHQTGLAADVGSAKGVCELEVCFGDSSEGKWLASNAHTHGFIIRYPRGAQNLTGYEYEPWHLRYVGVDLANQIYAGKQTLEQFFGLPMFSEYPINITTLSP